MAGSTEQPPSDDRQDVIRRALEKLEELQRAPQAEQALQDRVLSELGVDPSGKREPGSGPAPSGVENL